MTIFEALTCKRLLTPPPQVQATQQALTGSDGSRLPNIHPLAGWVLRARAGSRHLQGTLAPALERLQLYAPAESLAALAQLRGEIAAQPLTPAIPRAQRVANYMCILTGALKAGSHRFYRCYCTAGGPAGKALERCKRCGSSAGRGGRAAASPYSPS